MDLSFILKVTGKASKYGSLEAIVLHSSLLGTALVTCSLLAAIHLSHLCSHRVWVSAHSQACRRHWEFGIDSKSIGIYFRSTLENNDSSKRSRVLRRGSSENNLRNSQFRNKITKMTAKFQTLERWGKGMQVVQIISQ